MELDELCTRYSKIIGILGIILAIGGFVAGSILYSINVGNAEFAAGGMALTYLGVIMAIVGFYEAKQEPVAEVISKTSPP